MNYKLIIALPLLLLSGCAHTPKPDIVATSFVSFDAVHNIVGDKLSVKNIVPWGSELHTFEPSPQDIVMVNEAKLFIYTSPSLDTWVKALVENDNIFDMSKHYTDDHHDEDEHDHDHDHSSMHYWTNPHYYIEIFDALLPVLNAVSPANSDYFTTTYTSYRNLLIETANELQTFLEVLSTPTIYFAGHNAMDAFAHEFDLNIRALSESYKPDVDFLSPALIAFIDELKANDVHYLFVEELVEPRTANIIKNELAKENYSIEILELHGYHNITATQAKEHVTYAQLFQQNVSNIKQALRN